MRITFMLSGGFAGAVRGCRIDTAGLAAADRVAVEGLVVASGLVASFERFAAAARDRRQYDLAIDRAETFVRVSCDDASLPDPARPLVAELVRRSTPQPLTFAVPDAAVHAAVAATPASSWGRFVGDVVAKWEADGRDMTLVEPFAYVDPRDARWAAPAGAVVNGASIPRAFWSLIGGPFEGRFRNASVVHDVACVVRDRPWQEVHRLSGGLRGHWRRIHAWRTRRGNQHHDRGARPRNELRSLGADVGRAPLAPRVGRFAPWAVRCT